MGQCANAAHRGDRSAPSRLGDDGQRGGRHRYACAPADIAIVQTGSATVEVTTASDVYQVEVELFRAENRYVAIEPMELEPVEPDRASQR